MLLSIFFYQPALLPVVSDEVRERSLFIKRKERT